MKKGDRLDRFSARRIASAGALFITIALLTTCYPARPSRAGLPEIRQSIMHTLELPTYERVYRDIIYIDKNGPLPFLGISGGSVLFSVNIHVRAGVSFVGGVRLERKGANGVLVHMPIASILSVDADETSLREYFVHNRLIGGTTQLDYYDALEPLKERAMADSVEAGILRRADENAHGLIEGILHAAGFSQIEFVDEADA